MSEDNEILFCWIPSHTRICGKEQVDKAARSALSMVTEKKKKLRFYIKIKINKYKQQRQYRESNNEYNKLLEIKPISGEWKQHFRKSRKREVVLSRLRIGNTRFTHSYLLKDKQPMCPPCQTAYTKYIFIECIDLSPKRERFYNANSVKELFKRTKVNAIML